MFGRSLATAKHYTAREGQEAYENWLVANDLNAENFPFKVKTGKLRRDGVEITMRVESWGFYQNANWEWVCFICYRANDKRYTCAYHWYTNEDGKPYGEARKLEWVN